MLEIILINAIAPSPNWEAHIKPTLPIEMLHEGFSIDEMYLAKGKPYQSDYSREVERERRRYELDNLRHRDRRYYRDEDRRRRSEDEYRRDSREYERHEDGDRHRRRNSYEELELKMERLERQVEVLERRLNLR